MNTPRQRLKPKDRKAQILDAMLDEAEASSYVRVTREGIAQRAGCSPNLVSNYFSTMPQLRRTLMRAAVKGERLKIVAQGIVMEDKHALEAPEDLRQRALAAAGG